MADENNKPNGEGEGAGEGEVKNDAFGEHANAEAQKAEAEKGKGGEGEKGKKFEAIPDDHPTIVALKQQIDDIKKEYGGNLSGQRDLIKTLEGKIETLTKGGKGGEKGKEGEEGEVDVLFKEIKWSKDLTQEQRDEMTDTEIKQMDEIAAMKEAQNKMYAEMQKKGKTEETKKVEDLNSTVKDAAKELAKNEDGTDNVELANQIIESVKMFNLTGLDEKTVKERVLAAAKLVSDYKPPKEQTHKKGKAMDGKAGEGDDPFGNNKIVEEARSGKQGDYAL